MLKKIGDGGFYHVSYFGLTNYYDSTTKRHEHGYGLKDIVDIDGNGLRFNDLEVLQKFINRNPRIQFNPNGMFMILEVRNNGYEPFLIVEYEGYAYSVYLHDLKFMALYDKKACDFHKGLV